MSDKTYFSELQRTFARSDVADLQRQIRAYYDFAKYDFKDFPGRNQADIDAVYESRDDPEKALAYVMLAAANYDDPEFLAFVGAGLLEDVLREPSPEFLQRIVDEGRKTPRFRWLLSVPFRVAISKEAWEAISPFRITGDHEEPTGETLPPRPSA